MSKTNTSPLFGVMVILAGTAFILLATLWPFDFQWHTITWRQWLGRFDLAPKTLFDFPRNIVLFMPLGGGTAALLGQRGMRRGQILWLTLLVGFLLTSTVETLQVFLPTRTPSFSDVLANSLGAACGFVGFELWQQRRSVGRWLDGWLSVYKLIAISSGYFLFMLTLALVLMYSMQLGHWNSAYPLALGNELTSNRPWQGSLRDLVLLDRAVDPADARLLLAGETSPTLIGAIVADYPLVGADGLADRTGTLPNLVWRSEPTAVAESSSMLQLDGASWLATGTTAAPLARRINETGQFTLAVTLATGDTAQTGPARIVTNSNSPYRRNLTLGQAGDRLVLRFRTRHTSENATTPELYVPGILDGPPRRIVVSYDGFRLRIYSADPDQSIVFALGPEVAFVGAFVGIFDRDVVWPVDVDDFPVTSTQILFYSVIFLPLGALLAVASVWKASHAARTRWAALALVLPALVLEIAVAGYGSFAPRITVVALGVVITAVAFVTTRYFLRLHWDATREAGV